MTIISIINAFKTNNATQTVRRNIPATGVINFTDRKPIIAATMPGMSVSSQEMPKAIAIPKNCGIKILLVNTIRIKANPIRVKRLTIHSTSINPIWRFLSNFIELSITNTLWQTNPKRSIVFTCPEDTNHPDIYRIQHPKMNPPKNDSPQKMPPNDQPKY